MFVSVPDFISRQTKLFTTTSPIRMNTRGSARKTQFSTLKQIVASENLVEELKLERFNQVREAVQDMGNPQVAISQTPEIDDVTDG